MIKEGIEVAATLCKFQPGNRTTDNSGRSKFATLRTYDNIFFGDNNILHFEDFDVEERKILN